MDIDRILYVAVIDRDSADLRHEADLRSLNLRIVSALDEAVLEEAVADG
jgi:Trk K+ transport system NAD-binding subunit